MKENKKFKNGVKNWEVDENNNKEEFFCEDTEYHLEGNDGECDLQDDKKYNEDSNYDYDDETHILDSDEGRGNSPKDEEVFSFDDELSFRLKKVVKIIDLLEFVDSCLIVSEKLLKDDEDAREILRDLRERVLMAETIFTDYLISGKIQKPN